MLNINIKFMTFEDVREYLLSNNLEDEISSPDIDLFLSSNKVSEDTSSTFLLLDTANDSIYDNEIVCVVNNSKGFITYTSFLMSLISLNCLFPIMNSEGEIEEGVFTYDLEDFVNTYKDKEIDGEKVLHCTDENVLREFVQERLDLYKSKK